MRRARFLSCLCIWAGSKSWDGILAYLYLLISIYRYKHNLAHFHFEKTGGKKVEKKWTVENALFRLFYFSLYVHAFLTLARLLLKLIYLWNKMFILQRESTDHSFCECCKCHWPVGYQCLKLLAVCMLSWHCKVPVASIKSICVKYFSLPGLLLLNHFYFTHKELQQVFLSCMV